MYNVSLILVSSLLDRGLKWSISASSQWKKRSTCFILVAHVVSRSRLHITLLPNCSSLMQSFNIVNTPVILLFSKKWVPGLSEEDNTVNQQILAAIKFGVSQNKVIYVNLTAIKFGVSPRPVYAVYDRRICWRRQILAKTRNSPNSPNIIARQNLLIYSTSFYISTII